MNAANEAQKLTEGAIKALLANDEEVVCWETMQARFMELASVASSLSYAFRDRSRMLHELVELYNAEYWSLSGDAGRRPAVRDAAVARLRSRRARDGVLGEEVLAGRGGRQTEEPSS